jgi:hypothetical protein
MEYYKIKYKKILCYNISMEYYKIKYKKYKEKYILLKKILGGGPEDIRPGASRMEVEIVKYNDKEAIGKKMEERELNYFKSAQGEGVATIFIDKDVNDFTIMEKLKHIDLYNKEHNITFFPPFNLNEIFYIIIYNKVQNYKTQTQSPPARAPTDKTLNLKLEITEPNNKLFLELLNTIKRVNKLGLIWGDLKNNNLGVDDNNKLKIFDFGMTVLKTEQNNFYDLLAFTKLYYNALTNSHFFDPGRHYTREAQYRRTGVPTEAHYDKIINLLEIDDETLLRLLNDILKLGTFTINDYEQKKISDDELYKLYDRFIEYLTNKVYKPNISNINNTLKIIH